MSVNECTYCSIINIFFSFKVYAFIHYSCTKGASPYLVEDKHLKTEDSMTKVEDKTPWWVESCGSSVYEIFAGSKGGGCWASSRTEPTEYCVYFISTWTDIHLSDFPSAWSMWYSSSLDTHLSYSPAGTCSPASLLF